MSLTVSLPDDELISGHFNYLRNHNKFQIRILHDSHDGLNKTFLELVLKDLKISRLDGGLVLKKSYETLLSGSYSF